MYNEVQLLNRFIYENEIKLREKEDQLNKRIYEIEYKADNAKWEINNVFKSMIFSIERISLTDYSLRTTFFHRKEAVEECIRELTKRYEANIAEKLGKIFTSEFFSDLDFFQIDLVKQVAFEKVKSPGGITDRFYNISELCNDIVSSMRNSFVFKPTELKYYCEKAYYQHFIDNIEQTTSCILNPIISEIDEIMDLTKIKMIKMNSNKDLERFIEAQQYAYEIALMEIKQGAKYSHWMWFVFPQLKELGRSVTAKYYGIDDIEEARKYLEHPVLGMRLKEISEELLMLNTDDPYRVMGEIDGLKLCSSMTLFAEIEGYDSVFGKVIDKYYNGKKDMNTIRLLYAGE